MEKQQWKALYDFSNEVGLKPFQLVSQLKELKVLDPTDTVSTLDRYCKGDSYKEMMDFLRSNY